MDQPQAPTPPVEQSPPAAGQGTSEAAMPEGIKKFNWGAFLLTFIWGLYHKVWISLLIFIPIPMWGLVWGIILGIKGNEWAWKKGNWPSEEAFHNSQKKWAKAGVIVLIVGTVISIVYSVYMTMLISNSFSTF